MILSAASCIRIILDKTHFIIPTLCVTAIKLRISPFALSLSKKSESHKLSRSCFDRLSTNGLT